jgi:predicted ATPase
MSNEPFLNRVRIRNYKSLGKCEVELGRLTVLVGRNGSGKSNFLDALRFIAESLQTSLDHAIRSRGGVEGVRRRSYGHPHNFAIEVTMNLPEWRKGVYGFEIGAQTKGGFYVKREQLTIYKASGDREGWFRLEDGRLVSSSVQNMPPGVSDRLYLVNASGLPQFRPAYDALLAMGFYYLNPEQMKAVQNPDAGELLRRDGSNTASVVARLSEDRPEVKERIKDYLRAIVPDIVDFERVAIGHHETLEFRQEVKGSHHPWRFFAASMSDGTLRALGILVAVMQLADRKTSVQLVGIEEPETALHPAAAGALMDSLREAATHTQVLITTHSPDLLDQFDPAEDQLLVVQGIQGTTEIAPADPASVDAIRNHLYTAGDLLRMDQLQPDAGEIERQMSVPLELSGVIS